MVFELIFCSLSLVTYVLGLIGVVKEHKITMIVLPGLSLVGFIYGIAEQSWWFVVLECLITTTSLVYVYMIFKRSQVKESNNAS